MPESDQVESIEKERIVDTQTKSKKKDKPECSSNLSKSPTQPRIKRGPARLRRRLALDDSRITKLQNRLDRAKAQIDDAGSNVKGYLRKRDFRAKEAVWMH
jgi:hypothetical protein